MTCPKCRAKLPENAGECSKCGYRLEGNERSSTGSEGGKGRTASRLLSGFKRTLSTELVEKQTKLRIEEVLNDLIERRVYEPGDVIIRKGDTNRDLHFLTDGSVEVSTEGEDGNLLLNELEPPYILGDIAFLSGFPRTATARAKTRVETFIMTYETLKNLSEKSPTWLHPLLTAFSSGIKSLHFQIAESKEEIMELKKKH